MLGWVHRRDPVYGPKPAHTGPRPDPSPTQHIVGPIIAPASCWIGPAAPALALYTLDQDQMQNQPAAPAPHMPDQAPHMPHTGLCHLVHKAWKFGSVGVVVH